jgi:uracil-DNA glycosylase
VAQEALSEGSAAALVPEKPTLAKLREAAAGCRAWPRGKKRIHQKPNAAEIGSCRPWLDAEIALVQPKVLVCLGATAAQALLGRSFRVTRSRGELIESPLAPRVMATVHPSSLLRAPDEAARRAETARFVEDLRKAAKALRSR